jgi:hypothetical protein
MSPFIWFLLFLGIIFAIQYIYKKKRSERSEKLQLVAQSLGLLFEKNDSSDILQRFSHFHLFSKGHRKKIINRIYGKIDGIHAMIFGYSYTIGRGVEFPPKSGHKVKLHI